VTLVDRKSRHLRMGLVEHQTKEVVGQAIFNLLIDFPVYTITLDNGREFADHEMVSQALGAKVNFTHAYFSWERGTNENTNGLISQYFSNGTDSSTVSFEEFKEIQRSLNDRSRAAVDYLKLDEVFNNLVAL
jgi:IS30 family transposase